MWSLGATLFHVLAGRPPYDIGDNVLGGLYRIVNEEPPRLADAGWMAPLLEATMVKDPAQRWSMAQVRDFLGRPGPVAGARGARGPGRTPAGRAGARSRPADARWALEVCRPAGWGLALVLAVAVLVLGALGAAGRTRAAGD